MKFTLTIELGNDAMQTNQDIRDALKNVLCQVGSVQYGHAQPTEGDGAKIRDVNGNTVGHWSIGEGDREECTCGDPSHIHPERF